MEKHVELSESAVKQIQSMISKEQNPALMFRLSVLGGGCSGFQYEFALDDKHNDDDIIFEKEGVKLVTDETSLELLQGSIVDYEKSLIGSAFKVKNPNAASSCGCGTSFSIDIN